MKRFKKNEMLERVCTFNEVNDTICIDKINQMSTMDVFMQCQESAILIGNYIETLDEQYHSPVRILEEYCESLYQMSILLSDEAQCRKLAEKIHKQLLLLKDAIQYDLPNDRKEIVFLPYNASMWDSLESVWKVVTEDENCDTYVIPIPYHDKNPDGSFCKMHYEGDLYPDYVPVTNYEEYDFEGRRPDIIFIHNPYDEGNFSTSIHPFFYSKNLKQYTEKLVYIPYFILDEISPDNKAAVEGMRHFCTTSGVLNADKVIVQSENMRQVYINVLTEEMGDTKQVREYWEKKILGLGSPKIDKVLRTKREELVIPDEWLRIIRKPDGSFRKIVFYNTSITALLNDNEQMLKKMEYVFERFKDSREEIALLWRPHPLIESTIKSLRPQLWEGYKVILDKYIREGWGIYDDTADMDRAVVLSDAYYGDGSSIVQLYQKTGKPILLQNTEIKV